MRLKTVLAARRRWRWRRAGGGAGAGAGSEDRHVAAVPRLPVLRAHAEPAQRRGGDARAASRWSNYDGAEPDAEADRRRRGGGGQRRRRAGHQPARFGRHGAGACRQAVEAGIPVVTIDRRVDGVEGILGHVGADNVKGGEAQAQLIVEQFPDGAQIVNLQGQPGASPAIDRNQGVHNILDPHEGQVRVRRRADRELRRATRAPR